MNSGQGMADGEQSHRRHRGDFMSPATRSAVMARIKGRDTGPELLLAAKLQLNGCVWEGHARDLPGRPDFVFREQKLVVFVEGDFWHGWRFPQWRDKLSEKWEAKIAGNRQRDTSNHRRLRRAGWKVVRIWEHQLERDSEQCTERVMDVLTDRRSARVARPRKGGTR
ncbi:MAG: very short patch repair endonuclease [Hyphomicrobium sp.]